MTDAAITSKIVINGRLVCDSPLLIGAGRHGEADAEEKDTLVLKDNGVPFIPATSLAGVLRDEVSRSRFKDLTATFFGELDKNQSAFDIYDIRLDQNVRYVIRDGVSIDYFSGTGIDGYKYDFEALDLGASGKLRITLTLRQYHHDKYKTDIKEFLSWLLWRMEHGLKLGSMTSKGLGRVHVENLVCGIYDFTQKADLRSWFSQKEPLAEKAGEIISASLTEAEITNDFILDASFALNSSLIIRNYAVNESVSNSKIHAVSLYSEAANAYVIPGTSLKGVLRQHACFILKKIGWSDDKAEKFLHDLMGYSGEATEKQKSRLYVSEIYIDKDKVKAVPHTRNRIDRFTGGTIDGALYSTKPIYQKKIGEPSISIHLEIKNADTKEAGLMLLLLRDLWLGRVAIGGEKSVGRGTLSGCSATIDFSGNKYVIESGGKVMGDSAVLYLQELAECVAEVE